MKKILLVLLLVVIVLGTGCSRRRAKVRKKFANANYEISMNNTFNC